MNHKDNKLVKANLDLKELLQTYYISLRSLLLHKTTFLTILATENYNWQHI